MDVSLADKVVVVTGSSRGLGREMVIRLSKENASVVINYCNNKEYAMELYNQIIKYNSNCIAVQADVTKERDVQNLYRLTMKRFGKIDVLINNAGKCDDNYVQFMSLAQWNEVLTTNLTSIYLCSRVFSKRMIANGKGKIINIASLKGQLGSEGQCNYAASKAGVIGLTKSLAKEMGTYGISVNAICPGFIVTDLNRMNRNKAQIAERMSILRDKRSLEDFLSFVMMLCSDKLIGISGQVFNLDSRIN